MEPKIGRSIAQGFQTANRSWPGIGFMAVCWITLGLLSLGTLALTGIPWEAFQEAGMTGPANLRQQVEDTQDKALGGIEETADDETGSEDTAVPGTDANQARLDAVTHWISGAWPVVVLWVLVFVAVSLWLQAGQIGYLAKLVNTQQSLLSEFWKTGTRVFLPLLGAWGISLLAFAVLAAVIALLAWIGSLAVLPNWLAVVFAILMVVAGLVGLIWLSARILFWFVAIVVDRVGPVAGIQASLRATAGRVWKVLGLLGVVVMISIGVAITFGIIDTLAGFVGGVGKTVITAVSNILGIVVNLYLGFATSAAFIRFYGDTQATANPSASTVGAAS